MSRSARYLQAVYQEVVATGPATVRELSESLGMPYSTVHRHLKQLEAEGSIESDKYQRPDRVYMDVRP